MSSWRYGRDQRNFAPTDSATMLRRNLLHMLRGLLLGAPVGSNGIIAVGWCIGLAVAGYAWSRWLYRRNPVR